MKKIKTITLTTLLTLTLSSCGQAAGTESTMVENKTSSSTLKQTTNSLDIKSEVWDRGESEFNHVVSGGLLDGEEVAGEGLEAEAGKEEEDEDTVADANIDGDDVEIPQEMVDYLKEIEGKPVADVAVKDKTVEKKADKKNVKADKKNKKADKKSTKADKKNNKADKNKIEQPKKDNNTNEFNKGQSKKDNTVKADKPVKKDQPTDNNKQKPVKKKDSNKGGQDAGGGFKFADPNSGKHRGAHTDGNHDDVDMTADEVLEAIGG